MLPVMAMAEENACKQVAAGGVEHGITEIYYDKDHVVLSSGQRLGNHGLMQSEFDYNQLPLYKPERLENLKNQGYRKRYLCCRERAL